MDEAAYEDSDFVDVRARSFPAGSDFLNQGFAPQFGENDEDAWTDDDDDDNDDDDH